MEFCHFAALQSTNSTVQRNARQGVKTQPQWNDLFKPPHQYFNEAFTPRGVPVECVAREDGQMRQSCSSGPEGRTQDSKWGLEGQVPSFTSASASDGLLRLKGSAGLVLDD